jgi:hypothetical protein
MAVPIRTMKVDGELLDAKVQDNVIGGEIVRSMDGSSRLTIEVDDPDRVLLESGVLARAKRGRVRQGLELAAWQRIGKVQLSWEGTFWRLAGAPFTGSTTKLEWEPEVVVRLRRQTKHTKTSRNRQYSVLDFMSRLFHMGDVPATFVTSRLEELAVADVDEREVEGRRRGLRVGERVPGKDGYPLTPDQIRNANRALRTAAKLGAGERATLALIEACLIEAPNFSNPVGGDSSSVGILQLLDTHLGGSTSANGGRRDIELVVTMFLEDGFTGRGGAMQLARENPSWEPGRIAQACQGSAYPDRYEAQRANADRILEMFGGVGGTVVTRRQYVFHAGTRGDQEEDYFEAVQRLAREVRIRAFESGGRFWVGKDEDFLARMPITTVVERWKQGDPLGTYQVGEFSDGQWDYGERAASLSFSAALPDDRDRQGVEIRESRWTFAPGHVMDVRRMGPYTGRWLIEEIRQGIADEVAEFQLTKPGPAKPQPAPDVKVQDEPDPEADGPAVDRILSTCKRALRRRGNYRYVMTRPYRPLFSSPPVLLDCSSFVTVVWQAAGLEDPNRLSFNGQGYTGTLWSNAQRVERPRPGDLAFFGSPQTPGGSAHVNIYAGKVDGTPYSYNMGPSGGLTYGPTMVRSDFVGYRRPPMGQR